MLNQNKVNEAYETCIFNLAIGVEFDALLELQRQAGLLDEFEMAEGISLALLAWEMSDGFNASLKYSPIHDDMTDYEDYE